MFLSKSHSARRGFLIYKGGAFPWLANVRFAVSVRFCGRPLVAPTRFGGECEPNSAKKTPSAPLNKGGGHSALAVHLSHFILSYIILSHPLTRRNLAYNPWSPTLPTGRIRQIQALRHALPPNRTQTRLPCGQARDIVRGRRNPECTAS